jgi:putative tryptophan/tyrosine transport system substrate-binding protein
MRRRELLLLGGAMIASRTLRAQQKPMPVVGFLMSGLQASNGPFVAAFLQGLRETGNVEEQNVAVVYHWAEGAYDRLPALATDLVRRKVNVIMAGDLLATRAAKNATSTIPIIFEIGVDPVEHGLVASFARAGGNLSGISSVSIELTPKRVELLYELVPKVREIALLVNPSNPATERVMRDVLEAANLKGIELHTLKAGAENELETAFASLVELHAGAVVVPSDAFFNTRRELLASLAARHGVPAIYAWREFVVAGGLISYGPSLPAAYRQVGNYIGKIINGAKPADLPVQQPTIFELIINLKTAKALGLTIAPSILARASEVIE